MSETARRNISQPSTYFRAWDQQARRLGMNLSEWLAECANVNLDPDLAKMVGQVERKGRGNPNLQFQKLKGGCPDCGKAILEGWACGCNTYDLRDRRKPEDYMPADRKDGESVPEYEKRHQRT